MNVNWKVRFRNKTFITQLFFAFLFPILAYYQLQPEDLSTWSGLGALLLSFISNPFLLVTVVNSIWSAINDPTVNGLISDSQQAMNYGKPKKDNQQL